MEISGALSYRSLRVLPLRHPRLIASRAHNATNPAQAEGDNDSSDQDDSYIDNGKLLRKQLIVREIRQHGMQGVIHCVRRAMLNLRVRPHVLRETDQQTDAEGKPEDDRTGHAGPVASPAAA